MTPLGGAVKWCQLHHRFLPVTDNNIHQGPKTSRDVDPDLKGFPARLTQAREELGISGRELRERTGTDVSRLEGGKRLSGVSAATVIVLARALGVRVEWLLTGEGPRRADGRFVVLELTPEILKLLRNPAANLPAGELTAGKKR